MANKPNTATSYRSLNDELNQIIDDLQSNDIDIDRVISKYERGVEVVAELEKYLSQAENKVKKVDSKAAKSKA